MNAGQERMAAGMTEKQLEGHLAAKCRSLSLLRYHTLRSVGSEPGFPDDVIVGPSGVLYAEMKTAKGKVSPAQEKWLDALRAAGQEAVVWRPSDLFDGTIDDALVRLSGRRKAV